MPRNIDNKPLTIKDIREVLIPAMEEVFATKKDLDNFATKKDLEKLVSKKEFNEFKDSILTGQDRILKDLETLLLEKKVDTWQHRRRQKFYKIIINAMYKHKVLSSVQLEKIKKLGIF
ncbi:MAG: hypothetical protein WC650_00725 [Candidatus Doudnabacteria bacterium]